MNASIRLSGVSKVSLALTLALCAGVPASADDNRHQVSPFYGSFSHAIPIEVPPFHGVEPKLALSYSSEGRNGWLGVGWSLAGISTIERVNGGRGTPNWDASDTYLLDGQELVACVAGMVSPSCTTGGSHATKIESYLKIRFDPPTNTWTVWAKDGTRTLFSPTFITAGYTFRWGQTSVVDTFGNTVTYNWASSGGDQYPSTVTYNGYSITFYREPRSDAMSFGAAYEMGWTQDRFKSVFVSLGATPIRAYKLSYSTSAVTSRSLLTAVQQFGKDVAHTSGTITGGTSLPAQTFAYQNDTLGRSFQSTSAPPATPPNTQEPVTWARRVNVYAVGSSGSGLTKVYGGSGFNAGASSTRAITSGDGHMEYTFQSGAYAMIGLSTGDTDTAYGDINFALYSNGGDLLYIYENGSFMGGGWALTNGDILRVEVAAGIVKYRQNGVLRWTSTQQPTYPLLVDSSLGSMGSTFANVNISGALVDESHWCGGNNFKTADFNGDGRTDQFCYGPAGLTRVRLATASGFAEPTTWQSQSIFGSIYLGDFNGDGKTDILDFGAPNAAVSLSTGSSFGPNTYWGTANGYRPDNGWHVACYGSPTVADFNGDGKSDVLCGELDTNNVFVGISSGTSLSFGIWALAWCDGYRSAADFDGDGKDDYVCVSSSTWQLSTKLSTGGAFALGGPYIAGTFCAIGDHVITDLNGDGKADLACRGNGKVALSTGRVVIEQGTYGGWCSGGEVFGADADGDGEGDVVCNNPGAGATDIQVRQWTGSTLAAAETWKASWCNGSVRSGDYNGDGKMDLLCDSLATPIAHGGTNDFKSDIASAISNGIGGTTQLQYAVSTDFPNTAGSPPPKFVVSGVTVGDGRGGFAITTYSYSGARFDRQERLFLGFEYAKKTLPCIVGEASCPYEETYLRQDLASLGRPTWNTRRDGSGNLLSATGFDYATNGATLPRTSVLSGKWDYKYESGVGGTCTLPCTFAKRTHVSNQYDTFGNATQVTSYGDYDVAGDELTATWTYSPNQTAYIVSRPATESRTAGSGLVASSEFWYDGAAAVGVAPIKGATTTFREWLDPGSRWVARQTSYDTVGNPVTTTDATGRSETTIFDPTYAVFPISRTNGADETETMAWDPLCGVQVQSIDANAQLTTVQTDALCRLTQTTRPLGDFELRSYESFGSASAQRVVVQTPSPSPEDGSGNHFVIEYFDGLRRTYRTERKGPTAGVTILSDTAHNPRGGVSSRTSPYYSGGTPETVVFSYDALDRQTLVALPDGNTRGQAYGATSVTTTDENGRPSTTRFDAMGRRIEFERFLGGQPVVTTYSYDVMGRLTGMADALGNTWSWTFDTLARNIAKSDPDAGPWIFAYDDAGRMTSQADARGKTTGFTYDSAGRTASKANGVETISFLYGEGRSGYFNAGRRTTVTSNVASTSTLKTDYDALGRAVKETRTLDGMDYVLERRYDGGGRLKGTTFPDGDVVGTVADPIRYDAAGRELSIPGIVATVLYDPSGRVTSQTNANGTVSTRGYDPERGFLTGIQTTSGAATIQSLSYVLDPTGLVQQVTSPFPGEGWSYIYDDLYRLTSATSTSMPANSQTFAYDTIGRITQNSRIGTYTYPLAGQPRPHAPLSAGSDSYSYDANGNALTGAGRTLVWHDRNLLQSSTVGGVTTTFSYDGVDQRIKKANGTTTSVYPLGDDYEITNGTVTKYVSSDSLGLVVKKVGPPSSGATYWLHTDALGSVVAITDATGANVQRRTYRPYGEKIADTTSHIESRGWIDQRNDGETGLTYLHARYYDPMLGDFISPDPSEPHDPMVGTNRYAYGLGSPTRFTDRFGLRASCRGWKGDCECEAPEPKDWGARVERPPTEAPPWIKDPLPGTSSIGYTAETTDPEPPPPSAPPSPAPRGAPRRPGSTRSECSGIFAECRETVHRRSIALHVFCSIVCHAYGKGSAVKCEAACGGSIFAVETLLLEDCRTDYQECIRGLPPES